MCNVEITNPPELDHDALMLKKFKTKVHALGRVERRVLWNLLAHLAAVEWLPHSVNDGDDDTRVTTAIDVMELVFNLDDAWVTFKKGNRMHTIAIVLGNSGWDMISDWNYSRGDVDGFNAAMNSYDAERVADSLR